MLIEGVASSEILVKVVIVPDQLANNIWMERNLLGRKTQNSGAEERDGRGEYEKMGSERAEETTSLNVPSKKEVMRTESKMRGSFGSGRQVEKTFGFLQLAHQHRGNTQEAT